MALRARHMCMIYSGRPASLLARIIPLIIERIEKNDRVLIFANPGMVATAKRSLVFAGLDLEEEVAKGSVSFTSERPLNKANGFDPSRLIKHLSSAVDNAVRDGYNGLWVSGDMTWVFGEERNLKRLLDYEWELEKLLQRKPALSGVFQYHQNTLPLHVLGDALLTQPATYLNHTLHRVNPFFIPSESLDDPYLPKDSRRDIQRMLKQLESA